MADISKIKLPNGTTYDVNAKNGIYYVKGTQTAATGSWTGVISVPALYDGLTIMYYLPYAGSGNATLNLTLLDGTTTGAKNCYFRKNERLTTHYGSGYNFALTYHPAGSIAIDGTATTDDRWVVNANYTDGNDNAYYDRIIYVRATAGSNKVFPYTLVMRLPDGRWESIVTSSSTGSGKARNTHGFLFGQLDCMYYNETYNENVLISEYRLWSRYTGLIDYRYSFNLTSSAGFTANKPVYLVGSIGSDGLFYLDTTWWTQTLPSSANGKIYLYIGDAYDWYRASFYGTGNFRAYAYTNGYVREYSQDAATVSGHTVAKDVPSNAVFTDNNTTYTFANGTNGFTVTPSGGSAQTVTVTPSITNNVTGSGTSGYLTKFNGAHTITNGPQLGSSTTTFLRNDGTWATPSTGTDTKNTAGSTNNTGKLFLVGALEQSANPQTYSNSNCYIDTSTIYSKRFITRVNNVNLCEVGYNSNAGALLVNDSTGGLSIWMSGSSGIICGKDFAVLENVSGAFKNRVRHVIDTTDHFGKTTWYQGDNVKRVEINGGADAGINIINSAEAPMAYLLCDNTSSRFLMFSADADNPGSVQNRVTISSDPCGEVLVFGDNGYAGLIGDESRVICERMSYTNETVTFSKSSGSWTFRDGEYTRSGNVVQLRLAFKGGSSNVSVGGNAIVGTVNGIPTPPHTVRLQGYYSGTVLMGELTDSGGFNVRILGQALNLSSSNTATLSGTYVVED